MRCSSQIVLALGALVVTGLTDARGDTVGVAGAVNLRATGTPPGQTLRMIEIGAQVVRNEKVSTLGSGSVQIVFIDKTTLNIGPNSTVVIDEFVYSPAEATGHMTLSLGKGVLRIVGGQATHTGGATVLTEVATVGLRGAVVTMNNCADAARCGTTGLQVTNHFGEVTVTGKAGRTQTISRPGFSVLVDSAGQVSERPFRAGQAQVDQTNALLTSKSPQKGGSDVSPTDFLASQQGLGRFNAGLNPNLVPPVQGQTVALRSQKQSSQIVPGLTADNQRLIQTGIAQSAALATGRQRTGVAPVPPMHPSSPVPSAITPTGPSSAPPAPMPAGSTTPIGTTTPVTPPKTSHPDLAPTAYALMTTVDPATAGQSHVPYLTASFAGSGTWTVSKVLGYRTGGANADSFTGTASNVLQAGLTITGAGLGQSSGLFVATGLLSNSRQSGFALAGGFEGIKRPNAIGGIQGLSGSFASIADPSASSGGSVPVSDKFVPSGSFAVDLSRGGYFGTGAQPVPQTGGTAANNPSQSSLTLSPAATPNGLGTDHPNEVLQGYVGGLGQTTRLSQMSGGLSTSPAFIITNATNSPGDVNVLLLGNSSRMGAVFRVSNATASSDYAFKTGLFNFGALQPGDDATRGTYVDSRNFGAISNRNATGSETSSINGLPVLQNASADALHLMMVSSDTVLGTSATQHTSSLFPGVTFCACDYTRWGFWSVQSDRASDSSTATQSMDGHLLTWVGGRLATAADVPNVGSATYTGHVIASISNNGAQYLSASNFQQEVNFTTRTGSVSVPNLDGASYVGRTALNANTPNLFGGTIGGTLGRTMTLNGAFYQSATSPVGEMGGSVKLGGANNYLGGGIFAAHAR